MKHLIRMYSQNTSKSWKKSKCKKFNFKKRKFSFVKNYTQFNLWPIPKALISRISHSKDLPKRPTKIQETIRMIWKRCDKLKKDSKKCNRDITSKPEEETMKIWKPTFQRLIRRAVIIGGLEIIDNFMFYFSIKLLWTKNLIFIKKWFSWKNGSVI